MGSKAVEVSDETCHVNGVNHYSVNVGDTPSSFKNKACDSLQHTTSETSNLLSVNSSYDSLSENAESRAPLRFSNTSDDLEGADKLPNKYYDSKGFEVHEDNVSCLSRANDTNIALSNHNRNVERKNFSCSLASVGSVDPEEFGKPQKLVLSEMPPLKDAGAGSSASKEKLPECSGHMDSSSLTKEAASRQKVASHKGLEVSTKICSKFEVETSDDGHDPKEESLKYSGHDEQEVKSSELVEAAGMQPSQSVSGDDESDIVEHDVKVCDICGDAGREDMLATCSRCSDGAEHVYCMRKMLRRVPKGDWLCEECKFAEETDNQKQDIDGKRMKKAILSSQLSNKRRAEITEVVPSSKRQTLETRVGSPKSSSPKRTVALSRESSFKSMDKDKLKSAYQTSHSPNDISETARTPTTGPRLQTAKGALLKSNSFNTLNSKPKVKLVDNIVPQKQKGSKEQTSLDMKERAARMMGKSVSFKSTNSGRSNVSESKVKMLSSKLTPLQDLKGLKQAKERSTIERKNLSKLERPLVSLTTSSAMVSTPKVDQASRGETSLLSSANNLREHKAVLSDGKLSTSSKAISLTYKGVESQSSPGRASPMSGMCSSASEQKSNQVVFHDEPLSSFSWVVEKLPADVDGKLEDMPRSWEMTNQADKTRETSVRCRPTVAASPKGLSCPICKEIGHTAESCKIRISQASITDVSPPRSYREVPRGSRLKDAIHAALLRKPEIYRKKTVLDQSDELFTSNMELSSEVASQDQLFISNVLNNNMCTKGSHDGQAIIGSSTSDSCKNTVVNNIKPHTVQLAYSVFLPVWQTPVLLFLLLESLQ
ncbi:hypothetical protein M0R45_038488 [Rubus argutus]|uniref:PHD-type domain-containing protein n=1 Tax=Rubus argutus TaxID=59490 RepID=A0AAW1W556_RUBAR